ncbi:MAG: hypothetical protein K6B74_12495 [Ruminococcus sp.]|nr:hypothetical protein [Ruminococcus sp.]
MEDFEQYIDLLTTGPRIFSAIIGAVIWVVVGNIMGRKAKSMGLSYGAHFCLCFFLRLIGLAISYIMIDKRKKQLYYSQMQQMPYNQPQQQLYGQQQYNTAQWQNAAPNNNFYASQAQNPYNQMYGNACTDEKARYMQQPYEQYPQYGEQYYYNNNGGDCNYYPPRGDTFDYRSPGVNLTYTCPHCGAVQDLPGRCLNCNEKVTNYYPFH